MSMEGLADYQKGSDVANRERHGLKVGDELSGGIGPDVEVVEIDDEGVKFSDGSTASHRTVCSNMSDLGLLEEGEGNEETETVEESDKESFPVEVGDRVQMDYNGPGYDPVFDVVDIEGDYVIHLSNGGTCYPRHFERDTFSVVS